MGGGQRETENDDNNSVSTKTRLYVGGLGATVSDDDLQKTFSSLGKVESIEIVRSKGRSFAYFDFVPNSDNAVSKLFSTYNGCMWKGGRLKIEKAEEHYLIRLRREWDKDAELANTAAIQNVDAAEKVFSAENLKKIPKSEQMQLRIFFPKLRKMKLIPFTGAGKHKYSFQRVDVPPLPMHFCDCEEHCYTSHTSKEEPLSDIVAEGAAINEKEHNIMMSVMNKVFERENSSKPVYDKVETAREKDNSINKTDDMLLDENDSEHGTDEDNLITNIVVGTKDQMALLRRQEAGAFRVKQESEPKQEQTSKDSPVLKVHESHKKMEMHSKRKRKSLLSKEGSGNEILSVDPKRKGSLQTHLKKFKTQPTDLDYSNQQSSGNFSWSRKSTWRDLSNTAFSISNLLPSIASGDEEPKSGDEEPKSGDHNLLFSTDKEHQNFVKNENLESQDGQSKEFKEASEAVVAANKIPRGASWLQKSSWTQLVTNSSNTSFSISQILPGMTSKNEEIVQSNHVDAVNSAIPNHDNLFKSKINESSVDGSHLLSPERNCITAQDSSNAFDLAKKGKTSDGLQFGQRNPKNKSQALVKNNVSVSTFGNKSYSEPMQTSIGDSKTGETCSFMRSAASMKEWKRAKAALSGSLKKKGNERK